MTSAPTFIRLIDDAASRREALDVSHSFIVQAPAGSGKTELLTQRYLALLARVSEPESVVAITFTIKAAAEMRMRVLKALEQAAATDALSQLEPHQRTTRELALDVLNHDREQGWNILQFPSRLRIQTIDALCSTLARSMPLLSEFGGSPEVSEIADPLYLEAAHRTLLLLTSEDAQLSDAVGRLLLHLDNDVPRMARLLADMLARRDQWLRLLGANSGDEELRCLLDAVLHNVVCEGLSRVRDAAPQHLAAEIVRLARFAARNLPPDKCDRALNVCRDMHELPGTEPSDVPAWLGIADLLLTNGGDCRKTITRNDGFAPGTREKNDINAVLATVCSSEPFLAALNFVRILPPERYSDAQWEIVAALLHLLPRAAAELKVVFAERNTVDFNEVAQAAQRALGTRDNPTDLAFTLGSRIEHLLVDEYQDTSITQQTLLKLLTATWDATDQRTLFLVGDPMQSIYRFREAEVGLFLNSRQRQRLGSVALHPLSLTVNFRSQPTIVQWNNNAFTGVFPSVEDIGRSAVPYSASTWSREDSALALVHVSPLFSTGINDDVYEREYDETVRCIELARAALPTGSLAVLVRARSHVAGLASRLRNKGILYRAVEINSLAERQIVLDLASLTRALLHVGDRLAWFSVLRAPWCGLSLDDLYLLTAGDLRSSIWDLLQQRTTQLSWDAQQKLARVLPVLSSALANRARLPLIQWVRGTWMALGGSACLNSTDHDDANSYFDVLESVTSARDIVHWAEFGERLKTLFAAPDPDADESLQIMTIHKAKGLEFDAVIVPGLGRDTKGDTPQLLRWMERTSGSGNPQLIIAPMARKGSDDSLYDFVSKLEREREQEEAKRLLYVAATRARSQLYLIGHTAIKDATGTPSMCDPSGGCLLEHLWPAVRSEFSRAFTDWLQHRQQPQAAPATISIAASAEPEHTFFSLPATWNAPAVPPPLSWQGERLPDTVDHEFTFDWASDTVRHVGTVTHAFLNRIAQEGVEHWTRERIAAHGKAIFVALAELGVVHGSLREAARDVERALLACLSDSRGRWILSRRDSGQCEVAFTSAADGRLANIRVDRTFVDEDGTRWIIDYKVSRMQGSGREEFFDQQQVKYRDQLERYALVFASIENRPVRLGLYFPLLGGWREWLPEGRQRQLF